GGGGSPHRDRRKPVHPSHMVEGGEHQAGDGFLLRSDESQLSLQRSQVARLSAREDPENPGWRGVRGVRGRHVRYPEKAPAAAAMPTPSSAAPAIDPRTMPTIAPALRPPWLPLNR